MLDINLIRQNPELVKKNLEIRKDPEKTKLLDKLLKYDGEWKQVKQKLDELRRKRNTVSQEINQLKKQGKEKEAKELIKELKELPEKIAKKEEKEKELLSHIKDLLMRIPNLIHESVPYGKDSEDNVEIKKWGTPKKFDFELLPHGEIIERLSIGDFKKSTEASGAGFYYLKGPLALLNQALIQFAIEELVKKGYVYIEPPLMLRRKPYEGVTDLADFENVMYKIENDDLYLIATAEHPIAALHMGETIDPGKLPLKYIGYSMCFRKEIGSHGVDTRGLFRTHQFNKVEQFIFCKPEESWQLHEELLKNSEELLQKLEIPYRVVNICTGDLGSIAAKKYDIEAWFPRQGKYQETMSDSNCTDYQARRLNVKMGKEGAKDIKHLHTLNNTAIATSRILVAILENYQNKDGSITIPKALHKYMHGIKVIKGVK